jgi:O-methyltransferase
VGLRQLPGRAVQRLPPRLRRIVDAAYARATVRPTYKADGLTTLHYSPFVDDTEFSALYDRMAQDWHQEVLDVRWRMWLFTRYALQARHLPGDFAEFGVYRGGCAWMLLSLAELDPSRRLHLFDTFEGIPDANLTDKEREEQFAGRLSDTSTQYVAELLRPWDPIPRLVAGDVFDTLPSTETGPLAFVHLDLNAARPTRHVLEHVYDRLVPGGLVVFDDYGWRGYEDQRREIDEFLRERPEVLVALPTGQAVLTKAG